MESRPCRREPLCADSQASAEIAASAVGPPAIAMSTLGLALGFLPVLLRLIVVMPVLGHDTWHLYRKVEVR